MLRELQEFPEHPQVIVMTGFQEVSTAVEAMKLGAYDYLTKPTKIEELEILVRKAAEKGQLLRDNLALRAHAPGAGPFGGIVTRSQRMNEVLRIVERVAPTDVLRAGARRERHRQGAGGARHPRALGARRAALRADPLRRPASRGARVRAVRSREGRVHRRRRRQARPHRAGRRRHALPRRDRRHGAGQPGEAAARAGDGHVLPRRRHAAPARWTCGWSPPPTATWPWR